MYVQCLLRHLYIGSGTGHLMTIRCDVVNTGHMMSRDVMTSVTNKLPDWSPYYHKTARMFPQISRDSRFNG